MKKLLVFLCAITFVLGTFGMASALPNGGFETGDFSNWSSVIPEGASAEVVTSITTSDPTYGPVEGKYFAALKTDGPGSETYIYQWFNGYAGQTVYGFAAFDSNDYIPFEDYGYVAIWDWNVGKIATPWYVQTSDVGSYNYTDWMYWSYTFKTPGYYAVQLGTANSLDSILDSYAVFDGVSTPEPSTLLLLGFGLLGLVGLRRKK